MDLRQKRGAHDLKTPREKRCQPPNLGKKKGKKVPATKSGKDAPVQEQRVTPSLALGLPRGLIVDPRSSRVATCVTQASSP
jgi:hypothetical protein